MWSVSAIRPDTGEGGVQLGSWADEADLTDEEDDESPLLSESFTDEPEEDPSDQVEGSALALQSDAIPTPPLSPLASPRRRCSSGYQARYGTLIPELAPPGLPAGFSIGFNTSSPGFALRRHHYHEHANSDGDALGRQIRSHSPSSSAKRSASLDGGSGARPGASFSEDAGQSIRSATQVEAQDGFHGGNIPNPKPRV